MNEYDVIVVGSGAGMLIVESALLQGLTVALVDKGPLGGNVSERGLHTIEDADLSCR